MCHFMHHSRFHFWSNVMCVDVDTIVDDIVTVRGSVVLVLRWSSDILHVMPIMVVTWSVYWRHTTLIICFPYFLLISSFLIAFLLLMLIVFKKVSSVTFIIHHKWKSVSSCFLFSSLILIFIPGCNFAIQLISTEISINSKLGYVNE
jgi:hypothetical protein